ncbi:MAG: glycoside hydrolase family 27 protein [Chitinophagaceae bacterium]|nr:glycoside hydrolase family 27 protein [Chitinophagaceae bacterium]
MKTNKKLLILVCIVLVQGIHAQKKSANLATTPPMGWNSYNSFGATVEEKEVRENALYMAKNLKQYGWNYIVIDFCWWYPHPPGGGQSNPPQFANKFDGSLVPYFQMDAYGRLLPDVRRFPSSANGKGFKPLADYIHSLGLKFGIHVMRGIPRQAVWYNTPILGTNGIKAKDIVDTTSICPWLNNMWGVNMNKTGAQEWYNSILKQYESWGVDYIKLDDTDLNERYTYRKEEVSAFHKAITTLTKPITLSLSLNMKYENREHAAENSELWRVSHDFWDDFKQLKEQFSILAKWAPHSQPGNWPDADMLQIGSIAKRGPVGKPRRSAFSAIEARTHLTLWSIFRSPLMMGGNLPENSALETSEKRFRIKNKNDDYSCGLVSINTKSRTFIDDNRP